MILGKMLIDGQWSAGSTGQTFSVINPATEEIIAQVPKAAAADVEQAVAAAARAFPAWSRLSPAQRGTWLRRASDLIAERAAEIARLMTQEQGKPLKEAEGEVLKGAEILRYYAEEGERVYGRIIANAEPNVESRVIYQPMGVAAAISPWNYPIELVAWKIGGALASGCTIVCKLPSETPLSPLEFIRCLQETGIPDGVVNAVTGSGSEIGPLLINNPLVKKVAFTGSTAVGREILAACATSLKKVSLELGGSLPMVICRDCDLAAAVAGAARRSFRNMGQICIAVNRIYVDRQIYAEFLEKFQRSAENLQVGDGLEGSPDLGPMCTRQGMETTQRHIDDALARGARLLCGGGRPEGLPGNKGYYYAPSILADVNHEMLVMQEETFGPLVGVMPFDTVDDAIELANDSPYGLAAIVYTNSLALTNRLTLEINAGNVAVNNPDAGVINAPYGGWKDSGFGHEHGPEGLYEYLHTKHIRVRYL